MGNVKAFPFRGISALIAVVVKFGPLSFSSLDCLLLLSKPENNQVGNSDMYPRLLSTPHPHKARGQNNLHESKNDCTYQA